MKIFTLTALSFALFGASTYAAPLVHVAPTDIPIGTFKCFSIQQRVNFSVESARSESGDWLLKINGKLVDTKYVEPIFELYTTGAFYVFRYYNSWDQTSNLGDSQCDLPLGNAIQTGRNGKVPAPIEASQQ